LKGRHFYDIDDIRNNTKAAAKAIPQNQFKNCFVGGLGAGIGAEFPKGSTMKVTTVVFNKFNSN